MFEALFHSTTIPILEQVVDFNQARHTVLAGNLANLDTPGYRLRDLSQDEFRRQIQEAIAARHRPMLPASPGQQPAKSAPLIAGAAKEPRSILYHDDSNKGVEYQVAEMVKNQMQHNLALSIMTNQMRLLETAISERV